MCLSSQSRHLHLHLHYTIEGTKSSKPLTFCIFIASIYDEQYTRWIEAHYVSFHLLNEETTHDIAAYTVWRKQTETLDEMHRNTSLAIMVVTDSNVAVDQEGTDDIATYTV